MYCIKCGTKNPNEAKYCYKCGTMLKNDRSSNNTYQITDDNIIRIYDKDNLDTRNSGNRLEDNEHIYSDITENKTSTNNIKKIGGLDKKNRYKLILVAKITICLAIILSLVYLVSYKLLITNKSNDISKVNAENNKTNIIPGNSPGNLLNEGIIAEKNNWIYYNNSDGLYKMKSDGQEVANISNDNAKYINIIGNYIYYINISNGNSIYTMKTDGTSKKKILASFSRGINIVGNWIYYCKSTENGLNFRLYKVNLDGTNDTKIIEDSVVSGDFSITNNLIYYKTNSDNGGEALYSVKLDGSDKNKILDNVKEFNVLGNYIYYFTEMNNAGLYKMRIDGTNKTKLSDDAIDSLNVTNDNIYYTINQHINKVLYSMNLDGKNKIKLATESNFANINVSKNFLFYTYGLLDDYTIKSINISNDLNSKDDKNNNTKIDNKENSEDFILPNSNSVKLKQSDLDSLTKEQLTLARNEIFARHGYVFTSPEIKSYFESKSWYHSDPSYDENTMSDVEKTNIQLIKNTEESK
ncbi:DUF5050 domain-containing protein [Clostridium sp.]|jgi:hypothetical protein|uniref:DUF5050 domain-containing protein n=1 Tax=Clostridium sp. TaxID=1506 RepID=UPI002585E476|nr:DUF5050 domain-containing protein [Clostridium sp.]MDF2503573.1 domain/zinc-ribbon domain [Clostridium sp.]